MIHTEQDRKRYRQKYCNRCGTYKDRACFAEYRIGSEPHCWCITCTRDYNAEHFHSFGALICTKCGKNKPISEFYKDKRKKNGLHSECKTCSNDLKKQWRKGQNNDSKSHK